MNGAPIFVPHQFSSPYMMLQLQRNAMENSVKNGPDSVKIKDPIQEINQKLEKQLEMANQAIMQLNAMVVDQKRRNDQAGARFKEIEPNESKSNIPPSNSTIDSLSLQNTSSSVAIPVLNSKENQTKLQFPKKKEENLRRIQVKLVNGPLE